MKLHVVSLLAGVALAGCGPSIDDPVPCILDFKAVVGRDTIAEWGRTVALRSNETLPVTMVAGAFHGPNCGRPSGPRIYEFSSSALAVMDVIRTSDTSAVIQPRKPGTADFWSGWSFNGASLRFKVEISQ